MLFLIKFIHYLLSNYFHLTSMLLRLLVVVDAHYEYVAGVVGYLRGIILALNLVDGSFFYYFTYIYYLVSCRSSHILAFCPSYLVICYELSTFATEFNIIMNLKLLIT